MARCLLLLCWCLPALAAPEAAEMLQNPGFELGGATADWWAVHPKADPQNRVLRDTSQAHTGTASGLIDSTGPVAAGSAHPQFNNYRLPARSGATLLLSYWTRSEGGAPGYAGIHSYAADGTHLGFADAPGPIDGTTWQRARQLITLPVGTARLGLALYGRPGVTVWFDDISLPRDPHGHGHPRHADQSTAGWTKPAGAPNSPSRTSGQPDRRRADVASVGLVAYDDTHLYAAWRCPHPAGAKLKLDATERDGDTWLDDSVELFCDPAPGAGRYVQICLNAQGVLRDSLGRDPAYNTAAEAATQRSETGWTAELAVPLADLPITLASGEVWGVNLVRNDRLQGEVSTWSPDGFHRPERFGRVALTPDLSARYAADLQARLPLLDQALTGARALLDEARRLGAPVAAAAAALDEATATRARLEQPGQDWSAVRGLAAAVPRQVEAVRQAVVGAWFDGRDDTGGFRLAIADSTTKVPRDQPVPAEALVTAAELLAGRDETESFQVVVVANRADLRQVTVDAPPLRGPGGALPLNWRRVDYVYTEAPKYPVAYSGWWPDPLLPAGPFDVAAGQRQPLWCSVSVPPDARPGRYTGEVAVTCAGQTSTVPVELEVLSYRLPRPGTLSTPFGLYAQPLAEWYHGQRPYRETMTVEQYVPWIRMMADYRLTPKNVAREYLGVKNDGQDHFTIDLAPLSRTVEPFQEADFTPFGFCLHRLPSSPILREAKPKVYPDGWAKLTAAIAAEWERMGLTKDVFIYGMDEPRREDYPILQEVYRKVRAAAPNYPLMQTIGDPNPQELVGLVDIWCPLTARVDQPFYAQRRAAGETLWTYVCVSPPPPHANLFVDQTAATHRVLLWQAWQQGCHRLALLGRDLVAGHSGPAVGPAALSRGADQVHRPGDHLPRMEGQRRRHPPLSRTGHDALPIGPAGVPPRRDRGLRDPGGTARADRAGEPRPAARRTAGPGQSAGAADRAAGGESDDDGLHHHRRAAAGAPGRGDAGGGRVGAAAGPLSRRGVTDASDAALSRGAATVGGLAGRADPGVRGHQRR